MYEHPALHDHVAGWAPVRSGQHNAEVHLSFKDTSAQHRQQLASAGSIQLTMHGAAAPVTLPVSTVASKQLPDVTVVRMHNVPGGINVHGLMDYLLKHFQFGPEYTPELRACVSLCAWVSSRWQNIGDTLTLHFRLFSRLWH